VQPLIKNYILDTNVLLHDPHSLISFQDINIRIKADALGLQAEDYETDHVRLQDLYTGAFELMVGPDALAAFRARRDFPLNGSGPHSPNEYCTLVDETNPAPTASATR
jgi:PhoH-like ATPase